MKHARRQFIGKSSALAASLALAASGRISAQARSNVGIEGELAPPIELDYWIDGNGDKTTFSVLEERGKWVFLKCFQNWCPACHSHGFPTLKAFADEFHGNPKVAMAGIQTVFEGFKSNTIDDVRELQLRYQLPITMGHDPGNPDTGARPVTMQRYLTGGTPWLILINPDGLVVFNDFHVNRDKLIEYVGEQIA